MKGSFMAYLFSENAQKVLKHLQENAETDETISMIAEKTGLPFKTVNAVVMASLQKRSYAYREEVEGFDKKIIRLTEEGKKVNPLVEK